MTCPLCEATVQMPRLLEGDSVYVMPDKFPLRRGHLLIATKAHETCFAALGEERDEMLLIAARLRGFVRDAYGEDSILIENGPGNQTVPHAHAHVIPVRDGAPPPPARDLQVLDAVDPWREVEAAFRRGDRYRYFDWNGDHRLQLGGNFVHTDVRDWVRDIFEIERDASGRALRPYDPEQIAEIVRRWESWR